MHWSRGVPRAARRNVSRPGVSGQRRALSTAGLAGSCRPGLSLPWGRQTCRLPLSLPALLRTLGAAAVSAALEVAGVGSGGERAGQGSAAPRCPPAGPRGGLELPSPPPSRSAAPGPGSGRCPPLSWGGGGGEKRALTLLELWVDNSLYFREVSSCPYPAPTVRRSQPPFRLVGNPVVYF